MKCFRLIHVGETDRGSRWKPWLIRLELDTAIHRLLEDGQPIDQESCSSLSGVCENSEPTDYPFTVPQVSAFSDRFRGLLLDTDPSAVQFIELNLTRQNGSEGPSGYAVGNITRQVDCIDMASSRYELWDKGNLLFWEKRQYMLGTFRSINRLVLSRNKIGTSQIFRLLGWPSAFIIREDVAEKATHLGLTGYELVEVQVVD